MQVSSRLWVHLIFPHCARDEPQSLLALRAVCRDFRRLLDEAPAWLWKRFTMLIDHLCYAERTRGWQGVLQGMEREARTKEGPGAVQLLHNLKCARDSVIVSCCGRVVCARGSSIRVYDIATQRQVWEMVGNFHAHAKVVVCDRWIVCQQGFILVLLDGVELRSIPVCTVTSPIRCSVASARVAVVSYLGAGTVYDVDTETGDVRFVRTVRDKVYLCERGSSYLVQRNYNMRFGMGSVLRGTVTTLCCASCTSDRRDTT